MIDNYWLFVITVYVFNIIIWSVLLLLFVRMFKTASNETKQVRSLLVITAAVILFHEIYFTLNVGTNPNQAGLFLTDLWGTINLFWIFPKLSIAFFGVVMLFIIKTRPKFFHKLSEHSKKEIEVFSPQKFEIPAPGVYMVPRQETDNEYNIFVDYVFHGITGMVLTRNHPDEIREKYSLKETNIIWISDTADGQLKSISTLSDVSILIGEFYKHNKKSVVLLDGVEYLVARNGFESVYQLLQQKRDQALASKGFCIIPVKIEAFEKKDFALLEVEFKKHIIVEK